MTRRRKRLSLDQWGLVISLTLAAAAALILCSSFVRALAPDPAQLELADSDPKLILARALVAEAGYRPRPDHPAILHVLRKRGGGSLRAQARMAVQYCSVFRPTDTPSRHRHAASTATWRYLRSAAPGVVRLIDVWASGAQIEDPCRGRAVHWGSPSDIANGRIDPTVLVDCGETANMFLSAWKRL